ncbi:hypothetical protein AXG93_2145s1520 [Marchantia polymorpha subsp. ruderalis]|uniref:Reverse transcriptase domain-containing protein n=1 Tax=Marchantia polymorpha subsp. ruderalis TaxID=1480154 RepID=A0A176VZM9_MARPO|nr:hypothetical protein AXG93_2145s1520 [Marchantia polymorpha subsp. ruderalis]
MSEMKASFQAGRIRGYQVGETVLLDYSLFADDMGVFIDDSYSSFQELRMVLGKYEKSSGARLNLSKSAILLLGMDRPPDWFFLTGCTLMQQGEVHKYLGAPAGLGVSKQTQDEFCTKKIAHTLGGWELRLLSFEARAVLLQFVLQAQPTFYASLIKLSATTCRKVEQLYRQFLWGYNKEGKAKRSLVRWDIVCRPKEARGLGIRSLADTKSSLMGKWIGAIIDETAGTWGMALVDLVKQGRSRYHRDIVRKHYSLSDLILTRQPLHLAGTEVGRALMLCWQTIQADMTWEPAGVAIPRYVTMRDMVGLTLSSRADGDTATKRVMAQLRQLKVTQVATLWRKKEELKRTFVKGPRNERCREEGSEIHNFLYRITSATGMENGCQPQMEKHWSNLINFWIRNTIDKSIAQWKESNVVPPQKQWLEVACILQSAIATSIVTRIEKWLKAMLEQLGRSEGGPEAPCTEGAAVGLDEAVPTLGGTVDIS